MNPDGEGGHKRRLASWMRRGEWGQVNMGTALWSSKAQQITVVVCLHFVLRLGIATRARAPLETRPFSPFAVVLLLYPELFFSSAKFTALSNLRTAPHSRNSAPLHWHCSRVLLYSPPCIASRTTSSAAWAATLDTAFLVIVLTLSPPPFSKWLGVPLRVLLHIQSDIR